MASFLFYFFVLLLKKLAMVRTMDFRLQLVWHYDVCLMMLDYDFRNLVIIWGFFIRNGYFA